MRRTTVAYASHVILYKESSSRLELLQTPSARALVRPLLVPALSARYNTHTHGTVDEAYWISLTDLCGTVEALCTSNMRDVRGRSRLWRTSFRKTAPRRLRCCCSP